MFVRTVRRYEVRICASGTWYDSDLEQIRVKADTALRSMGMYEVVMAWKNKLKYGHDSGVCRICVLKTKRNEVMDWTGHSPLTQTEAHKLFGHNHDDEDDDW